MVYLYDKEEWWRKYEMQCSKIRGKFEAKKSLVAGTLVDLGQERHTHTERLKSKKPTFNGLHFQRPPGVRMY